MASVKRPAACYACRRRKSRCSREPGTSVLCLPCRSHGTTCSFPPARGRRQANIAACASSGIDNLTTTGQSSMSPQVTTARAPVLSPVNEELSHAGPMRQSTANASSLDPAGTSVSQHCAGEECQLDIPISASLDNTDDFGSSQRLVGPIVSHDSQALSDYFSENPTGQHIARTMWTGNPSGWSAPVVFKRTRKRPAGLATNLNPAKAKVELMDKYLDPWQQRLVDIFLSKTNSCLPLVDEAHFRRQYESNSGSVSPALLACMYAHTMIFWTSDPVLAKERRPDQRFLWNLANQALYSELRLSPGISTIIAIILNIIGRPSTLVFNNAGQLGFAISLAYTLGLNRDPTFWDIPLHEKRTRVYVWQALTICDRWTSLAYGIPPHTRKAYSDIPALDVYTLDEPLPSPPRSKQAASICCDFARLTDVLDDALEDIYRTTRPTSSAHTSPTNRLNTWVQSTTSTSRHVVLRGSDLSFPGTANLRLAFLSLQFMFRRSELEAKREKLCATSATSEALQTYYLQTRHAAEEVVLFVQELGPKQLRDFWLPFLAYPLLFVMTFLIRSAIKYEDAAAGLARNGSFTMACDFMQHLLATQHIADWDIGDLCIREFRYVLEKLRECGLEDNGNSTSIEDIDALFPELGSSGLGLDLWSDVLCSET